MNRFPKFYYLLLAAFIVVAGCSKDDDNPVTPTISESAELVKTLEGGDGGYLNTSCPAIVTADVVYEDVQLAQPKNYLIDIRSAADFTGKGHIQGAHNVAIGDVVAHVKALNWQSYDKVVVICYTGQSAAWTTALLRMSGITNAYSMKFGMSSWHSDFDGITTKCTSDYEGQFTATATNKASAGDLPVLNTGKTAGTEILEARLSAVMTEGFSASQIDASTVFTDPTQYYIVNYWPETDYTSVGHIAGSIQYTPKADLKLSTYLKTLPANKTIVVYCYTGQTSSNVAAILRVMGYDAKSLKFGVNSMIWNKMETMGKKPFLAARDVKNFPYVK